MDLNLNSEIVATTKTKMVFVVGNSRSGTTIMARILGRNSDVHTFHEIHFFEQLWNPQTDTGALDIPQATELMSRLINIECDDYYGAKDTKKYKAEAQQVVEMMDKATMSAPAVYARFLTYKTHMHGKAVACEQTPRNVLYIAEILRIFPDALIINMVRDPRPILLSQKKKWQIRSQGAKNWPFSEVLRSWINYHPVTTSILWNASINATNAFTRHSQVKTVLYEEFVAEPDKTIKELCRIIGINYDEEMLNIPYSEGGTSSLMRTDNQQRSGIDKEASFRWLKGGLNDSEIYLCQYICAEQMGRYGYKPISISAMPSMMFALGYYITWPIHIGLALLVNINRHKNLIGSLRRRLFRNLHRVSHI